MSQEYFVKNFQRTEVYVTSQTGSHTFRIKPGEMKQASPAVFNDCLRAGLIPVDNQGRVDTGEAELAAEKLRAEEAEREAEIEREVQRRLAMAQAQGEAKDLELQGKAEQEKADAEAAAAAKRSEAAKKAAETRAAKKAAAQKEAQADE